MFDRLRAWLGTAEPAETRLARARKLARAGRVDEAISIWRPLAEAGNARAQTNLGAAYATGTPADPAAARRWLQLGAEAGDPLGQRNLATLLLPDDPARAAAWYRRASEAGDAESQDQLGRMLLSGHGLPTDPIEARRWTEAAAPHLPTAAARLATMCHDAVGGPRDPEAAVRWWRVAAEAGDGDSAARLGAALHMGQGAVPDQVEAMAWLLVAASRHSILVRPFFGPVQDGMTPDQLSLARTRARRHGWSDQHW